jgi:hypothetical protein
MAFLYIDRADKSKYGRFVENLRVQNSLKNDQYPDTIDEAHSVLSTQKMERWKEKSDKKPPPTRNNYVKNDEVGSKRSFNQHPKENMTCYCCGKKGHAAPECKDRDKIPREKWYINKAMSNMQDKSGRHEDKSEDKEPSGDKKKAWSGFQRDSAQCHTIKKVDASDLKDVIILDTRSTIGATFMNPKLLSDIKATRVPLSMVTNAGHKKMALKGKVNGFGDAWYDPDQIANIFGSQNSRTNIEVHMIQALKKHSTFIPMMVL